jgi:hypothetical protein
MRTETQEFVIFSLLILISTSCGKNSIGENNQKEIDPVALTCPMEPLSGKLEINHSFDWSPNRDTENILVQGSTDEGVWCLVTVTGGKVVVDECVITYSNNGYFKGNNGECTVLGTGTAAVEVTGSCKDGQLNLEISEYIDEAELGVSMTCPGGFSQPYPTFYPFTLKEATFFIQVEGSTVTERVAEDLSHSYSYNKSWTLIFPSSYFDMP